MITVKLTEEEADQLEIVWIDQGDNFKITEYDGYEDIEYGDSDWIVA